MGGGKQTWDEAPDLYDKRTLKTRFVWNAFICIKKSLIKTYGFFKIDKKEALN